MNVGDVEGVMIQLELVPASIFASAIAARKDSSKYKCSPVTVTGAYDPPGFPFESVTLSKRRVPG